MKQPFRSAAVMAMLFTLIAVANTASAASQTVTVAYAGSMGVVMDKALGPAFEKATNDHYRGMGQGAWGLARLLASGQKQADVFVSVTPGPMKLLIRKGLVKRAQPVASTQMAVAYNPKSKFAASFKKAANGQIKWYQVLEKPGLKLGRTDPATDPQGRNVLFTLLLAQRYYHKPHLLKDILGSKRNPKQIFPEVSLMSRLEGGQIDATVGYASAIASHHLPFIKLPPQINLSNPKYSKQWYDKVHLTLHKANGKTEHPSATPLVFYAGVLQNAAHPKAAQQFVDFINSKKGRALFQAKGYGPPNGPALK